MAMAPAYLRVRVRGEMRDCPPLMSNFAVSVVEAAPPQRLALCELARDGSRREWCFGEVAVAAQALAAEPHSRGVRRGDVALTLVGNTPDWVGAMGARFR